jgi:uncharacterized protein YccT (UPF0319 family)
MWKEASDKGTHYHPTRRQGNPLSPYLFILATEVLTAALKKDPDIKGITIDGTEYLDSLYADDTTITLENDEKSIRAIMLILKKFEICSGLKINMTKTIIAIKLGEDATFFNNA